MEQRKAKILINKAGGTAGADAKNYRVALPSAWINELGIDEGSCEVVLQFDGESITIRRAVPCGYAEFMDTARQRGHELLVLHFYDGNALCTKICADAGNRKSHSRCIADSIWRQSAPDLGRFAAVFRKPLCTASEGRSALLFGGTGSGNV